MNIPPFAKPPNSTIIAFGGTRTLPSSSRTFTYETRIRDGYNPPRCARVVYKPKRWSDREREQEQRARVLN